MLAASQLQRNRRCCSLSCQTSHRSSASGASSASWPRGPPLEASSFGCCSSSTTSPQREETSFASQRSSGLANSSAARARLRRDSRRNQAGVRIARWPGAMATAISPAAVSSPLQSRSRLAARSVSLSSRQPQLRRSSHRGRAVARSAASARGGRAPGKSDQQRHVQQLAVERLVARAHAAVLAQRIAARRRHRQQRFARPRMLVEGSEQHAQAFIERAAPGRHRRGRAEHLVGVDSATSRRSGGSIEIGRRGIFFVGEVVRGIPAEHPTAPPSRAVNPARSGSGESADRLDRRGEQGETGRFPRSARRGRWRSCGSTKTALGKCRSQRMPGDRGIVGDEQRSRAAAARARRAATVSGLPARLQRRAGRSTYARQAASRSGESARAVSHTSDCAARRLKFGVSSQVLP